MSTMVQTQIAILLSSAYSEVWISKYSNTNDSHWASQVALVVNNSPANTEDVRDAGSVPGSGRSPGGGPSNPLQYSSLENPTDRAIWRATFRGITKSWTWLKRRNMHADQKYNEVSPHTSQNGHRQKNLQTRNAGEDVEKREPSCTVGGNANWCNRCGEQYGGSLRN